MLSINNNSTASAISNVFNSISRDMDLTNRRIATGKRILSASDDPAGSSIVSSLKSQSSSYDAVQKNLSAGMSLLDVASTALSSQQTLMTQMKTIATQAASGTLSADQRTALQNTFTELQTQLNQTANGASLFGQNLTGTAAATVQLQTGISAGNTYSLTTAKSDAATLAIDAATIDITDATKASAAMTALDTAIATVSSNQGIIGAQQNALKAITQTATNTQENLVRTISNIEDVDMAAESTKLAQLQTKQQLAGSMLSIANQTPSYILQLLR